MKKILALVLAMLLLCSLLVACGGKGEPAASSKASSNAPSGTASAANDQDDDDEEDYDEEEADEEEADEEEADEEEADSDDVTAEYEEVIGEFIDNFEGLMGSLGELLAMSQDIASEEDLFVWCEEFDSIKAIAGASADELANVAEHVPEVYQESHVKITIAVAAIYDAMTGFEDAVAGAINGDADAFDDGIAEFVGNVEAADALWADAME